MTSVGVIKNKTKNYTKEMKIIFKGMYLVAALST